MTISEFAEQIVHSTDLEAKLAPPASELRDMPSRAPLATPATPGRPPELRLVVGTNDRAAFPRESDLRDDRHRGRLLHFFANHELLATELMALALLKFPETPDAFRRGLLELAAHLLCGRGFALALGKRLAQQGDLLGERFLLGLQRGQGAQALLGIGELAFDRLPVARELLSRRHGGVKLALALVGVLVHVLLLLAGLAVTSYALLGWLLGERR